MPSQLDIFSSFHDDCWTWWWSCLAAQRKAPGSVPVTKHYIGGVSCPSFQPNVIWVTSWTDSPSYRCLCLTSKGTHKWCKWSRPYGLFLISYINPWWQHKLAFEGCPFLTCTCLNFWDKNVRLNVSFWSSRSKNNHFWNDQDNSILQINQTRQISIGSPDKTSTF